MWTLLFDIDGTLLSTKGSGMIAISRAMKELFDVDEIPKLTVHGRTDQGIIEDLFAPFDIDVSANIQAFKELYWKYLPDTLHQREGFVLPGVFEVLDQLWEQDDVAMGIITGNTERSAQQKLEHFGLRKYFHFGGYGDHHRDRNEVAREALVSARAFLGERFDPERLWMMGDTANDVRCARAIESKVIVVETGGGSSDELVGSNPDLQVENLADPEPVWRAIFGDNKKLPNG